jgi:hypothetical protein
VNATTVKKISLPTKSDEIAHLREFVTALPQHSYLYSCLGPFIAEFERDVYSDFIPSFAESWAHRTEARHEAIEAAKELRAIQDQVKAAKAELADQVNRLSQITDSLATVRRSVDAALRYANAESEKSTKLL